MLVHVSVQRRRSVLPSHVMVVRHTREVVVRAGWNVHALRPLLALEVHVAALFRLLEVVEQDRHAVAGRVLQRERDEDESHAQHAELIPRDRVLFVEPLKRRRVVEREARRRETLSDLGAELFGGPAFGGWKLAPEQVGHPAVEVAEAPVDGKLEAAIGLGCMWWGHAVGESDDDESLEEGG